MSTRSPLAELNVLKKICDHPRLLSTLACEQLGLDEEDRFVAAFQPCKWIDIRHLRNEKKKLDRVNFCKDFWDFFRGLEKQLANSWPARPQ